MSSPPPFRLLLAALTLVVGPAVGTSAQVSPGLPPAATPATPTDLLVARESVHPTGFPRVLILDAPGSDLVTFRLSIPVDPGVEAATAAPILQRMASDRIAGGAETMGAQVEAGASATAISYTVTGALADLDHLTFLLRQATAAPLASQGFAAARGELEARLSRVGETGEGRVESELRSLATPGEASVAEVRERLRSFTYADLESAWRLGHQPERMTLLVVGDVTTPVLLAALAGLGVAAPAEPLRTPIAPSPPSRDRSDILRQWIGFAWATSPAFDPRAVVAASLASQSLREGQDGYEAYVRLWEGRNQDVLALVGSAYGADARALRRRLSALPGQLAESLSAAQVDDAVRRLHWNLISQARTPWGRANLVGRFIETDGTPDAARRYVDTLLGITVDDVRAFFATMAETRAVTVEAGL